MTPSLISVKSLSKYQIELRFNDGTEGIIDLSYLSGRGVFKDWDNNDLFFRPFINEMGTVAWNDYLDIDLLNAYLTLKNSTFDEWKQTTFSHAAD